MGYGAKALRLTLLAVAAGLLAGCDEFALEPAPGPYYGDRLPTHNSSAKPSGSSVAPSGAAIQMEILPLEATTLTQTPQILVATVHDVNGVPCRNCRVEWKLEGVGEIVAVEESGASAIQGRKTDSARAVSYTASAERRVARDGDAQSGFLVKPGQCWCIISSATVGDTRVTVHAGDSPSPSVVVRHWVQDDSAFPQAATSHPGGEVMRAQYQGNAVFLTLKAPAAVAIGQRIPCTLTVTNAGAAAARAVTIRAAIPDGLQFVDSKPAAALEDKQLVWMLAELPARSSKTMEIAFKSSRLGAFTQHATLSSGDGTSDDKTAVTEVVNGQLKVSVAGPAAARLNEPASYEVTVCNLGSGPATHVLLTDTLDSGLEHATKANPIELPLGVLAPGEKKTAALVLTPRRPGTLVHHLTAMGDGQLTDKADTTLVVGEGKLDVRVLGPTLCHVGRPAVWEIQVSNPGAAAVSNVVVSARLPAETALVSASEGGQALGESKTGGTVSWHLGTLAPREQKAVQISTRCETMTERATLQASVAADAGVKASAEAALAIRGLPTYRLQVVDLKDPIQVGDRTTYKIDVTNQGSLVGKEVQITADVPPQLRILDVRGPVQPKFQGQRITFPPVEVLPPKQMLTYEVDVQALQPNDAHFHVELHSPDITDPVTVEESTTIYAPGAESPAVSAPPSRSQGDSFGPSNSPARPSPDRSTTTGTTPQPPVDRTGSNWGLRR
jgi:uncharacterized repeat protein (TIGR01451 family)